MLPRPQPSTGHDATFARSPRSLPRAPVRRYAACSAPAGRGRAWCAPSCLTTAMITRPPDFQAVVFKPERDSVAATATHHILVAEDNPGMLRLLARALRRDGHDVVVASNGLELMHWVEVIANWTDPVPLFDLIVTDLRMPVYSGQDCLDRLHFVGKTTPVILITAFGDEQVHRDALAKGARAVVDKPLHLEDLCTLVARTLG
jgi:CheY-like chemotaxis protein